MATGYKVEGNWFKYTRSNINNLWAIPIKEKKEKWVQLKLGGEFDKVESVSTTVSFELLADRPVREMS
ncbi:MAG: hypothetical protein KKD77_23690 [Gammaproteobacteria bacterium]|nr:hypothetical protein [Gammaproteobacteria bacterium]